MSNYFVGTTSTTSNVLYSNTWWSPSIYYDDSLTYQAVQTARGIEVMPYKSPAIQKGLVEGALLPESPLAWLKRRVDEVCWVPA